MPTDTPFTRPDEDPIVATVVLLLVHDPPPASLKVVDNPEHTDVLPEIAAGSGLMVTFAEAIQPVARLYVIVAVPPDTPVTIPLPKPTVATVVLPLVHVPVVTASLSAMVNPVHTVESPVIAAGRRLTVTVFNAVQPVASV